MPDSSNIEILRAPVFHTPRNPFLDANALVFHDDGALAIDAGRIAACGAFHAVHAEFPHALVRDLRGGYLLPGFVDTHVHFPQIRILGGIGYTLLDWLDRLTLPEESRFADESYARLIARDFIRGLASHGTTTALVFGAHFAPATAQLFDAAARTGLRIASGLVLSDRRLRHDLHQSTEAAYRDSKALIGRFHRQGRLRYAVTPRFALSASEAMLEVCQTLLREDSTLLFTTHINEAAGEIEEVARLFPWAVDYLAVYERYQLLGARSVLAHNVHASDSELHRLAGAGASIAHCPASNAALGSGIFPMRRHLEAKVHFALGSDVGGGTGFSILKEARECSMMQRLAAQPMTLTPAQLLWLATLAGAQALALADVTGDFTTGKAADFVYVQPPLDSVLESVLRNANTPDRILSALFTLADAGSVREVQVEGRVVWSQ